MRFFAFLILAPGILCREPVEDVKNYLTEYIQTGKHQKGLDAVVTEILTLPNITYQNEQVCATCKYVIDGVLKFRKSGVERQDMLKLVKYLCNTFSKFGQLSCDSFAEMEIDAMLYMIDHRKNLTADRVCSIYLQHRLCKDPDENDWTIIIPPALENIEYSSHCSECTPLKIAHLTDIHVDPLYKPGSDADCGKPLCCQSGTPNSTVTKAGYWGDYHVCDMPWHSVFNLFDQVNLQHENITYIYYTGDIIAHTWFTSREENSKVISELMQEFRKNFPNKRIFPVLGNHEAHPCDYYAPLECPVEAISTQWLFDLVANEWSNWLPKDALTTVKKGGYYTVLVSKGFRIIALNSNVGYVYNLWLFDNDVDPYGQLQWLANTLAEAEKMGEFVHILSHIPPGSIECWKIWAKNYNKIVARFSKTIRAQFNGHTHLDELRVFFDEDKTKAVNVAFNGGSFTTFVGNNPNYRVYDVDPVTLDVLDYEEWIYNMTAANQNPSSQPPNWYRLYSFCDAYGMKTATLSDIYNLTQRMANDPNRTLLKQYRRFTVRDSDAVLKEPCNDKCLDNLMCSITSVEFADAIRCV